MFGKSNRLGLIQAPVLTRDLIDLIEAITSSKVFQATASNI